MKNISVDVFSLSLSLWEIGTEKHSPKILTTIKQGTSRALSYGIIRNISEYSSAPSVYFVENGAYKTEERGGACVDATQDWNKFFGVSTHLEKVVFEFENALKMLCITCIVVYFMF